MDSHVGLELDQAAGGNDEVPGEPRREVRALLDADDLPIHPRGLLRLAEALEGGRHANLRGSQVVPRDHVAFVVLHQDGPIAFARARVIEHVGHAQFFGRVAGEVREDQRTRAQGHHVARPAIENLRDDGERLLADAPRLRTAPELRERFHLPRGGLRIGGRRPQILKLQVVDAPICFARRLQRSYRLFRAGVSNLREAQVVGDRGIRAPNPQRRRAAHRGPQDRLTLGHLFRALGELVLGVEHAREPGEPEPEPDQRALRAVASAIQSVEDADRFRQYGPGFVDLREVAQRPPIADEGQCTVSLRVGRSNLRREAGVIVDGPLRQAGDDVEPPDRFELEIEVVEKEDDELLGLAARALRHRAGLQRLRFGFLRALHVHVPEESAGDRADGKDRASGRDLARANERLARRRFAQALRFELPLRLLLRLALVPEIAACDHHRAQHVVRELHPAKVEPFFDPQQPAIDERGERIGRGAGRREAAQNPLFRDALAEARLGEHLVLDEAAHTLGLVGESALVELAQDRLARAGHEVRGNLAAALGEARVVELTADEGEERRLDFGVAQLRSAGDEAHDRLGDLFGHELAARFHHRGKRLLSGHAGKTHAILRDRGHLALQALEVREVILAQCDEDSVVGAVEVEALGDGILALDHHLERLGCPVLDQVRQVLDEFGGALASEVVVLPEGEDLLELVEDEERDERVAALVAQHVVAMVKELPQRFARDGGARPRPLPQSFRRTEDRLLDLLRGRRRIARVVDAHVHRAEPFAPEPRHDARAQDRGLAQARLAEEDRERLPLHAPRELRDLLLAPVEELPRLLAERVEAEPRMLAIHEVRRR